MSPLPTNSQEGSNNISTFKDNRYFQKKFLNKFSFMRKKAQKRGPKEDCLKLNGKWESVVSKALAKKRPKKGWPKTS